MADDYRVLALESLSYYIRIMYTRIGTRWRQVLFTPTFSPTTKTNCNNGQLDWLLVSQKYQDPQARRERFSAGPPATISSSGVTGRVADRLRVVLGGSRKRNFRFPNSLHFKNAVAAEEPHKKSRRSISVSCPV